MREALGRRWRRRLGLSPGAIGILSALAAPRAIGHDLGATGAVFNGVLTVGPVLVWIVVAVGRRVPSPLATLGAVGAGYGVLLAIIHQVLWDESLEEPPRLGGNLADVPEAAQDVIFRVAAVLSSLVTGILVGMAAGLIATMIVRARARV